MDHYLWAGSRDWTRPISVLVAGGGTGDGLIQLAQTLADAGRQATITYLDLSRAALDVAQGRAEVRGLTGIRYVTGDLLTAPDLGLFDYIDCCGVLHHMADPVAGLRALRAALAPGGGLGFMVYGHYGRSGVYPLQEAFAALFAGLSPQDRLARARGVLAAVPQGHPFKSNPNIGDHLRGNAEFYDLLLHSQDQAFDVPKLIEALSRSGWQLASFASPGLYDLHRLAPVPPGIDDTAQMALAEKLRGTIKVHVGYARPADAAPPRMVALPDRVPHLRGEDPETLASLIDGQQAISLQLDGAEIAIDMPKALAPALALINGRRSLREVQQVSGLPRPGFADLWAQAEAALLPWDKLHYSRLLLD